MKVTLDIIVGHFCDSKYSQVPTKGSIQKTIDSIQRAIDGRMLSMDSIKLIDVKYILKAIQSQLPESQG